MRTLHVAIIAVLIITPLVPIALGVPGTIGIADEFYEIQLSA